MKRPYRSRDAYRHWRRISTRWHDNDVYAHVNNTVYYAWFDTAVNAWLMEAGLLELEGREPIGLVIETGCRYAAPVAFPAEVDVGLAIGELGRTSVTYNLGIFALGLADAAAEGHFTHVYVDRGSRRPVPIPADVRATMVAELLSP